MDIVIAFFALGMFASVIKSNLEISPGFYQSLSLLLMISIGLKGGIALSLNIDSALIGQSLAIIALGLVLPLAAYPILRYFGELNIEDSASIAAHYGSVSIGTYAVAIAVLESQNIYYEPYFPLFVVLLEAPAIAVGIALAKNKGNENLKDLFYKIFTSEGLILLSGGLLIGFFFGHQADRILPLFGTLFYGLLALFLLHMGIVAGGKIKTLQDNGIFILSFGIFMPMLGALLGGLTAIILGFSLGGVALLAVLGASASYIAVPAAMAYALPNSNQSLSITASLAVTFPFNILVGIPLYLGVVQWILK